MDTRDILKIVGVAVGIVIWGWSEMRKQAQKKKEQQQKKAAPKRSVVSQQKQRVEQSWTVEEPVRAASEIVAPSSSEEVGGTVEGTTDMEGERRERVAVDLRTMVISSELLKPKFEEF